MISLSVFDKEGETMSKKELLLMGTILAVSMMAGCATQRAWTYRVEPNVRTTAPVINKSVVVHPLFDGREYINENNRLMALVPIVPYGWQDLKIPEAVQMHVNSGPWLFKPSEDLAKAIAEELDHSGIFKEVLFTNGPGEGELFLRGEVKSTGYHGKLMTYGLSITAPILWLFGLPSGYVKNVLGLSIQLVDTKTNKVVWEGTYEKREEHADRIYVTKSDFLYDRLLKEIMKEALPSMKNRLAKYQE